MAAVRILIFDEMAGFKIVPFINAHENEFLSRMFVKTFDF